MDLEQSRGYEVQGDTPCMCPGPPTFSLHMGSFWYLVMEEFLRCYGKR